MKNDFKKYELVNKEGCLMLELEFDSYKKARNYFNMKYEGNYKIICEGKIKNVRLK